MGSRSSQESQGRWLAVRETKNRGWWLPAGLVDPGETFQEVAHRETLEEAGILVELKGVLRVEHSVCGPTDARMRVIFYAEPLDETQRPKQTPDKESEEARWVTLSELVTLGRVKPGLRGTELLDWGNYIEGGGGISPMTIFTSESEAVTSMFQVSMTGAILQGNVEALEPVVRSLS